MWGFIRARSAPHRQLRCHWHYDLAICQANGIYSQRYRGDLFTMQLKQTVVVVCLWGALLATTPAQGQVTKETVTHFIKAVGPHSPALQRLGLVDRSGHVGNFELPKNTPNATMHHIRNDRLKGLHQSPCLKIIGDNFNKEIKIAHWCWTSALMKMEKQIKQLPHPSQSIHPVSEPDRSVAAIRYIHTVANVIKRHPQSTTIVMVDGMTTDRKAPQYDEFAGNTITNQKHTSHFMFEKLLEPDGGIRFVLNSDAGIILPTDAAGSKTDLLTTAVVDFEKHRAVVQGFKPGSLEHTVQLDVAF